MLDTIFPVGSMYTQYPGALSPKEIFENAGYSGSIWVKQFNTEGVTFRTEGGGATSFGGGVQQDAMQRITGNTDIRTVTILGHLIDDINAKYYSRSPFYFGRVAEQSFDNYRLLMGKYADDASALANVRKTALYFDSGRVVRASDETRMKNRTFIVWKRTK